MSDQHLSKSRLRIADILLVGSSGLRTRKMRTALSALGVTIGIAAMVGVLGLSESSRADLRSQIEALGTNLLTVSPSTGFGAGDGALPDDAVPKIQRIGPVDAVADVVTLDETVLRNDYVNPNRTGGIDVVATHLDLLATLNGTVVEGAWLNEASASVSNVVLGSEAADRLSIVSVDAGPQVVIGGEWFTVVGILDEFPLAPNLDRSVLIGQPAAVSLFDVELNPSIVYLRASSAVLDDVRTVLAATVDPAEPDEVSISRPSDALEAEEAADSAFTSLFLGLGAVALLVGGIGIANVMVIAVIERRNEIGLRRALGATKAHIRRQFLTEALLLSTLGGLTGVALGAGVTAAYATTQDWEVVVPPEAMIGGFLAAIVIGVVAGLYPASRAARMAPTEALRAA
ncbi:MAG: putative ABC transport system permease protein [Candidatus Aldehydirespiratoraceae bacterium]|jgi:putative ABC transport system permease protein